MGEREITLKLTMKSDDFEAALGQAATKSGEVADAIQREWDRQLGEVTRLALSGAWRADVEAYEMMAADVARLPEVDRLLTRCVRDAAQHNLGDAIDSARSAAAACREVPSLGAAVDRIVAILEAP